MSVQPVEDLKPGKDVWTGNQTINELSGATLNPRTTATPAVANFSDSLLFTYKASNSDFIIQCLYKDKAWSQDIAITVNGHNIGCSEGPSLAVFNGTLYMAYRSSAKLNGGYPIMLATLASGETSPSKWQGDTAISIGGSNLQTDHAPSLTVQGTGTAARMWLGWQKDSNLYTATFDGTNWTNNGQIKNVASNGTPASNYGPALCGYQNSVWVIFKGRYSNNLMWCAYNVITQLWNGNQDIEDKRGIMKKPRSDRPPGIALFDGSMYITYKAEDGNDIYQAMLTDQAWSGNKAIYDTSDISPESDTTPGMASALQGKTSLLILANKSVGTSEAGTQIYVSELK